VNNKSTTDNKVYICSIVKETYFGTLAKPKDTDVRATPPDQETRGYQVSGKVEYPYFHNVPELTTWLISKGIKNAEISFKLDPELEQVEFIKYSKDTLVRNAVVDADISRKRKYDILSRRAIAYSNQKNILKRLQIYRTP